MFSSGQEFGVKSTLYTCWRLSYISLYPLSIHLSSLVSGLTRARRHDGARRAAL